VASLVPPGWTLTTAAGHIAHPCFGAWEECGTLSKTYRTNTPRSQASQAVRRQLVSKGWTIDAAANGDTHLSARDTQDVNKAIARVYVDFCP
jgi:hypothetical protein